MSRNILPSSGLMVDHERNRNVLIHPARITSSSSCCSLTEVLSVSVQLIEPSVKCKCSHFVLGRTLFVIILIRMLECVVYKVNCL